ncbi:MAG: hypothetical protein DMG64_18655 [Acidobacteria bacterium]|nr:MAG: hypothetical protein DMG64_18655 [Acidobacteriota bacterium]PYY19366.1 MAG: hypothetical protein DMG62_24705 [Acidobacteriota bacterium]
MPFQPSQRAVDFMRCALPEQRRYFRVHLPIRAVAVFRDSGEPQNAFLRDINMLGAFFYCKHKPSVGQSAKLEFDIPGTADQIKALCEGLVVRVEERAPEAAIGIAVEFASYSVAQPAELKGSAQPGKPFIGWTIEMVERMFEKFSQLAHPIPKWETVA